MRYVNTSLFTSPNYTLRHNNTDFIFHLDISVRLKRKKKERKNIEVNKTNK